ncbi:hypothetical protein BNJ_00164 [Kaumoebavirus]|uniref:hypothetical protein n=1 Tax=Kaumoebavirus TaxID=1859492 RepID=UPI0009C35645|nr:hypothetical protein BNJ_00164 [Kaumoebavirus]ARA71996.1 hypothetical protein BNJ_00164 [Kaumoebavirus]
MTNFVPPIYLKHQETLLADANIRGLFLNVENVGFLSEILFQSVFKKSPILKSATACKDLRAKFFALTSRGTQEYFEEHDLDEFDDLFEALSHLNREYLEFSYKNILLEPQSIFLVEPENTTESAAKYNGDTWAPENMFLHNAVNGGDNAWRQESLRLDDAGRKGVFPYNQYESGIPFWQIIRNNGLYEDKDAFDEGLQYGGRRQLENPVYKKEGVQDYKKENIFTGTVTPSSLMNYTYK